MLISGFPGIGKSQLFARQKELNLNVVDSDSSKFSWLSPGVRNPHFITDYLDHIKSFDDDTIVMISSHKEIRDALEENNMLHYVIYPDRSLKSIYIENYIKRGNNENFIMNLSKNWDTFIDDIIANPGLEHRPTAYHINICLSKDQYLYDLFANGYCIFNKGFCDGTPSDATIKHGHSRYPYYCTLCANMIGKSFFVKNGKPDDDSILKGISKALQTVAYIDGIDSITYEDVSRDWVNLTKTELARDLKYKVNINPIFEDYYQLIRKFCEYIESQKILLVPNPKISQDELQKLMNFCKIVNKHIK